MQKALEEFGLTQGEIKVYLALLKLGSSSAGEISKESQTNRTNTYDILNSLGKRGLVSSSMQNETLFFKAADPNRLLEILKEKEQKINSILPSLKQLQKAKTGEKINVELYLGIEGLKTILDDVLRTGKEIVAFGCDNHQHREFGSFIDNFMCKRVEQRIPIRIIVQQNERWERYRKEDEKNLQKTRFLEINAPLLSMTYGEKLALLCLGEELYGILIESAPVAQANRMI